jgi:hypothetical protein
MGWGEGGSGVEPHHRYGFGVKGSGVMWELDVSGVPGGVFQVLGGKKVGKDVCMFWMDRSTGRRNGSVAFTMGAAEYSRADA